MILKEKNKACFLDRDGVINVEKNYVHRVEDLVVYDETYKAIALLRDRGFKVIVITNQGGVAKGYYKEQDVFAVHTELDKLLAARDLCIDAYYYCLHHPGGIIKKYAMDCDCRKPAPGMILRAARDLNIDLSSSFMVGDKMSDIKASINAGCLGILVKTGHGFEHIESAVKKGIIIKENILDAVRYFIENKM
ncbi:MAG TPA: D-glycero-beta-D-manno-heptose-1,7-bisphosphate 7-phosphatase [Lentisphaeria bacterium]|nr:MAG: hypothetical protein A2X47_11165 [Lentisphaerae bacterium GWF2_38_69]HBM16366.1 D-glycero-beta-D-manno-heptose-1,7-bisphosphate 7-phosphatase [Lentisphaeria bacterium]